MEKRIDELKEDIRVYREMMNDKKYANNNIGRAYKIMLRSKIEELNYLQGIKT